MSDKAISEDRKKRAKVKVDRVLKGDDLISKIDQVLAESSVKNSGH